MKDLFGHANETTTTTTTKKSSEAINLNEVFLVDDLGEDSAEMRKKIMKPLKMSLSVDELNELRSTSEGKLLTGQLIHANLIQHFGCYLIDNQPFLILEYCNVGISFIH